MQLEIYLSECTETHDYKEIFCCLQRVLWIQSWPILSGANTVKAEYRPQNYCYLNRFQ